MFDDQPVHRAMERIFTPLGSTGTTPPVPLRVQAPEAPVPRRRWFMGKDGIAAVGFALTVTALGMVMMPLLSTPAPPPSVPSPSVLPAAATPPMVARVPAAVPAPSVLPQPAPLPASAPVAAAPVVATPASPVAATPRPRAATIRTRAVRRHRARTHRSRHYRREASRLTGAALRRALARDVVVTRRLNQEALRRLRGR